MKTTHHAPSAGVSLLEVVTAVAVAAILMALAVPQLPVWRAHMRIGSSARQIAIDLQRARMKAVGENAFYRVVFSNDGTYVLQTSPSGITFTNDSAPVQLAEGVQFVGTLPQLTFNRLGTLAAPASVSITNTVGQTKIVHINVLGRITIS